MFMKGCEKMTKHMGKENMSIMAESAMKEIELMISKKEKD